MSRAIVERIEQFREGDLDALCQATEDAVRDGIGFNWENPPSRQVLENYWKGVLVVPGRELFIARLDGSVAGAIQLLRPGMSHQTSAFAAQILDHFVAPWARGHGLAGMLLDAAEMQAIKEGFGIIRLSVRETQERAIQLYESHGYTCWGTLPMYERIGNEIVAGHFFYKLLDAEFARGPATGEAA